MANLRKLLVFGTGAAVIGIILLLLAFYEAFIIINNFEANFASSLGGTSSATFSLTYATVQAVFLGAIIAIGYGLVTKGLDGLRRQEQLEKEGQWSETVVSLRPQARAPQPQMRVPRPPGMATRPRTFSSQPATQDTIPPEQTGPRAAPEPMVVESEAPPPRPMMKTVATSPPPTANAEMESERPIRWEGSEPEPVGEVATIAGTKDLVGSDTTMTESDEWLLSTGSPVPGAEKDVPAVVPTPPQAVQEASASTIETPPIPEPAKEMVLPEPSAPVEPMTVEPAEVVSEVPLAALEVVYGYCMKCKTQRAIKEEREVTMKNGRKALQGTCTTCGSQIFKILGKKK